MSINIVKDDLKRELLLAKRKYDTPTVNAAYTYSGGTSKITLDEWLELSCYTNRYKFVSGSNNATLRVKQNANYPIEMVAGGRGSTWPNYTALGNAMFLPDFILWDSSFSYATDGSVRRSIFHTYMNKRIKIASKNASDVSLEFTFSSAPSSYTTALPQVYESVYYLGDLYIRIIRGSASLNGSVLTISPVNNDICVTVCKGNNVRESPYTGAVYGFHTIPYGAQGPLVTKLSGSNSHLVIQCSIDANGVRELHNVVYCEGSEEILAGNLAILFASYGLDDYRSVIDLPGKNRLDPAGDLGYVQNPFFVMQGSNNVTSIARCFGWTMGKRDRGNIYTDESDGVESYTYTMPGNIHWVKLYLYDKHVFFVLYAKAEWTSDGADKFEKYACVYANLEDKIVGWIQSIKSLETLVVYQANGATESASIGGDMCPTRVHKDGSWQNFTRGGSSGDWQYEADGDWRGFIGPTSTLVDHCSVGALLVNVYPSYHPRELATYFYTVSPQEEVCLATDQGGSMDLNEELHYAGFTTGLPYRAATSIIEAWLGNPTFTNRIMLKGALQYGQTPWYHPSAFKYCLAWDGATSKYVIINMSGTKVYE